MQKEYYDVAFFPDTLKRGGAERVTIRLSEYMQKKGILVMESIKFRTVLVGYALVLKKKIY